MFSHFMQGPTPRAPVASLPRRPRSDAALAGAAFYLTSEEARDDRSLRQVDEELHRHVLARDFPCVAARSAFNKGNYRFGRLAALGSTEATVQLHRALTLFSEEFDQLSHDLVTYAAVFDGPASPDERHFETLLWQQLQALHGLDARHHAWAGDVSSEAASNDFSFSVGGRAFFIVGMHPEASRISRRTPRPTLVFNFHEQFEDLRARDKYEGMKSTIRQRDLALQGSINPVLARFGESSEARQYAGRAVPADWQCPFHKVSGASS